MRQTTCMKWLGLVLGLTILPLLVPFSYAQTDLAPFKALSARSIGPAGMSGRVTSIDAVVANPDIIYVGTASGGLWMTQNSGITWKPLFDEQPTLSIGAVAIHQPNPQVIWVGTGEGNPRNSQSSGYGVYRSLDGGETWTCMGLEETRNIHRIIIHPNDPNVVYVGAQGTAWGDTEERGLYKTTDGGKTWTKILYNNQRTGIGDLVMDPHNPNKLIAAMWEFRRWPWYFKSGGEGSGMYVTYDGGENWEKRTEKDGLPKGELGRIGLAIAPSNTDIVYALVESKKNALYKSTNGGKTWEKINEEGNINVRPFYFWDLFVDPVNENRIYSLYSMVSMSEDGGKSFKVIIPYSGVHPDHHAWWIHPENPSLIIDGNDGGMAISRDRAKNWRFVGNLPLAQFYHIDVDEEIPYNVYGGMQDNGSWKGPAYTWRAGGILNSYWEELFFGDGFDVSVVPKANRYGYAMSQGGNVARIDMHTGNSRFIKPIHPDDSIKLRFNWNAALAQDPFDADVIYYGSQFVHQSGDRGENWSVISPDLTTNDTSKQKQDESGGLTIDATNAENHTTILCIAPSPLTKGEIWVGTDDGNLQLTRNDGNDWVNIIDRLPGAPDKAWIPQIHPSQHRAGEAFVVINNYRQNDWAPYLYHTKDYGESWENLVDPAQIEGHCLSFVQDPIEPRLMFLGTETGLYVSFDEGENWNLWKHGFPRVSTIDLKIHPREHDLVIGTFGRAAFVIDDIRPLRAVASEGADMLTSPLKVFEIPDAYLAAYRQAAGLRFGADNTFAGQNRKRGAAISFIANKPEMEKGGAEEEAAEADSTETDKPDFKHVKVEIFAESGELIRTLTTKPDSGVNRVYWRLNRKGIRYPGSPKPKKDDLREPSGMTTLAGTYKVRLTFGPYVDSTTLKVLPDPRMEYQEAHRMAHIELAEKTYPHITLATEAYDRIEEANKTVAKVMDLIAQQEEADAFKDLKDLAKTTKDTLKTLKQLFVEVDDRQGYTSSDNLTSRIYRSSYYLDPNDYSLNQSQRLLIERIKADIEEVVEQVNGYFEEAWPDFQTQVEEADLQLFKAYEPLKLD